MFVCAGSLERAASFAVKFTFEPADGDKTSISCCNVRGASTCDLRTSACRSQLESATDGRIW